MNEKIKEILELNERIEHLNDPLYEAKKSRRQVSRSEFIDIINQVNDDPKNRGRFVSMTYVNAAAINKTRRGWDAEKVNQALDDTSETYGETEWHGNLRKYVQGEGKTNDSPIKGVVAVQRYLFHWHGRDTYKKEYAEYKNKKDEILKKYNVNPDWRENHNKRTDSDLGVTTNQTGNLSFDFNMAKNVRFNSVCYLTDENGNLVGEIPGEIVKALKSPKQVGPFIANWVREQCTEETLELIKDEFTQLDKSFNPKNFIWDKILCMVISSGDSSYYFINDQLKAPTGGKNGPLVNQSEMIKIAEEQLGVMYQELHDHS